MAVSGRINNFSTLVKNNFYKITKVETYKTDYTPKQVVYTLENGQRLFGRPSIDQFFNKYKAPFFFKFKGLSDNELFRSYKFSAYKDAEELLTDTFREIEQILMHYIVRNQNGSYMCNRNSK